MECLLSMLLSQLCDLGWQKCFASRLYDDQEHGAKAEAYQQQNSSVTIQVRYQHGCGLVCAYYIGLEACRGCSRGKPLIESCGE